MNARETCGCKGCDRDVDVALKITAERVSLDGIVCSTHADMLTEILNPVLVSRRLLRPVSVKALEQQR